MRGAILGCLLMLVPAMTACRPQVPKPPAGVPATAVYVAGNGQTGYFIHIEKQVNLGWKISIYDPKGAITSSGEYRLVGFAKAEIMPDEMQSCDGRVLVLKDGTQVVPVTAK